MFSMRGGGLRVGCDTERCMLKLRCGFDYMQREGLIKSKGRKKEKQNKGSLYLLGSCNYCLAGPRHRARFGYFSHTHQTKYSYGVSKLSTLSFWTFACLVG